LCPSVNSDPGGQVTALPSLPERADGNSGASFLATIDLCDSALSVSAVWGKFFEVEGKKYGHIIDPRSGHPVTGALLSAVALESATETDALSTALLTLGSAGLSLVRGLRDHIRCLVLAQNEAGQLDALASGIVLLQPSGRQSSHGPGVV
jgi:thiamine biosynthesis lipoprotein